MRTYTPLILIFFVLFTSAPSFALDPESTIQEIQRSHIDGNVPDPKDFDSFLRRDIAVYFESQLKVARPVVRVDLLRKGPTQSGVAYPKFYAWVVVNTGSDVVVEGAVRVAAIDRNRFEVTTFLSKQRINADPDLIATIFPASLVTGIRKRASP